MNLRTALPLVFATSLAALSSRTLSACGGDPMSVEETPPPASSCPSNRLAIEVERGNDRRCLETNPPYNPNPTVQVLGISRPGMMRLFTTYVGPGNPCPTSSSSYRQIASAQVSGDVPYYFFPLSGLTSGTCLLATQSFPDACSAIISSPRLFSCGF